MTWRGAGAGLGLGPPWDIVLLGRLAGVAVIASGVALAIWNAVGVYGGYGGYSDPLKVRVFTAWMTFVSIAWGGVAIILLAELLDGFLAGASAPTRKTGWRIRYRRRSSLPK
jgi:hypothetical protein